MYILSPGSKNNASTELSSCGHESYFCISHLHLTFLLNHDYDDADAATRRILSHFLRKILDCFPRVANALKTRNLNIFYIVCWPP